MARFTFPEWTQSLHKWVLLLVGGAPLYILTIAWVGVTPEALRIGYMPEQKEVPYSHAVHVGELGLDCRYCHNTVEDAAHAAVPPSDTCMNCHKAIHATNPKLLRVREASAGLAPLKWTRVHDLPDYVFFNHSAHVRRGVGCESCHGRVDQMEEVYQHGALTMAWCLDCHRAPEKHLRPLDKITEMGWPPEEIDQEQLGARLVKENNIKPPLNCSTCHR